jgi:hypothetical protein
MNSFEQRLADLLEADSVMVDTQDNDLSFTVRHSTYPRGFKIMRCIGLVLRDETTATDAAVKIIDLTKEGALD